MRVTNRRLAILTLLVLLGLSFAACSASAATPGLNQVLQPAGGAGGVSKDQGALPTAAPAASAAAATLIGAQTLIIKTGQLDLQVSNPEASAAQANGIVEAAGGYVSASARSGDAETLVISVTYRIPVARWDATLASIHGANGGGTLKILNEQIQTQDVTASAVDLDARLTNLRATEQALLGIMARATTITDTLAVQTQLTTVRGQIEELQAQRNQLGDQAAFSTLTVQFQATPKTQTTSATSGWSINGTIDDATATLVKLGQGLASLGVWLVIVGLPVGLGLFVLFLVYRFFRRIRRRRAEPPKTA
ncbi:MAG: DUF4349 domain-containing protein [Candidatus Limnocylindrales bacterium]